jgi:ribonuclease HI
MTRPSSNEGYAEIFCDGASNGNPGHAGIGVVIIYKPQRATYPSQQETYRISEYIGVTTNNVAEYSALIKGLKKARALKLKNIKVFLDSELLVNQINGIYRVKNKNLRSLWVQVRNILKDFDRYVITHVQREMNREADSLARKAIKNKKIWGNL